MADQVKVNLTLSAEEIQAKLDRLYAIREREQELKAGLTQQDIDIRGACEESLSVFLQYAWQYIDPAPYIHNWHIDAISEHLMAVSKGELRHLLINQPPRTAKSALCSVAFVPWIWTQQDIGPISGPQTTALYASYAQTLSLRDSLKARRLVQSPWYQRLWGSRFQMTGDQNTKSRFENDAGGYRLATSVGSALTGEGGQLIVGDDCHNAVQAESELVRQGVLDWWDTALSTRHNDPKTGSYVVVMQRLHENDLTGHIVSKMSDDWTWLMLPMRYESARHCVTPIFEDPRTEEGELLWPERMGEKEVRALEVALGPYGASGQLQQSPLPKGGGIIRREDWKLWGNPDDINDPYYKRFPMMEFVVASLDPAYTEKQENDYSALVVLGVFRDKNNMLRVMLMGAWQERLAINDLVNKTAKTCERFHVDKLLIENKASGISVGQEMKRLHGNAQWSTQLVDPRGQDKVARTHAIQHIWGEGIVYAPDREYADLVINQMSSFPRGKHDDLHDAVIQGITYLRNNGLILRKEERDAIMARELAPQGPDEPLYDV